MEWWMFYSNQVIQLLAGAKQQLKNLIARDLFYESNEFRGIYSWLWINWRRRNMAATLQMPFPNSFSWQFDWFECRWFLFLRVQFRRMSSSELHKWASCQIRNFAGCACAAYVGSVFPATDFKGNLKLATPTCTTARASCTCRDACWDRLTAVAGKTFRAFQAHVQPTILRIW